MARLNGVKAILAYLGYRSRKTWIHLARDHRLPYYRDRDDPRRVWAQTDELDQWDQQRSLKNGHP